MKKATMADLKDHLFDVIERLKEGNDPNADPKDSIDLERAKVIGSTAKVIVDIAKTEVLALGIIAKSENPTQSAKGLENAGLIQLTE